MPCKQRPLPAPSVRTEPSRRRGSSTAKIPKRRTKQKRVDEAEDPKAIRECNLSALEYFTAVSNRDAKVVSFRAEEEPGRREVVSQYEEEVGQVVRLDAPDTKDAK